MTTESNPFSTNFRPFDFFFAAAAAALPSYVRCLWVHAAWKSEQRLCRTEKVILLFADMSVEREKKKTHTHDTRRTSNSSRETAKIYRLFFITVELKPIEMLVPFCKRQQISNTFDYTEPIFKQ